MNTFKNHDLHEKTTKRKTCSGRCSSCCFPNVLKNVSTNINRNSYDENTLELRSSKVDECSVREWIKVEEHDQFKSHQFRCKLCNAYGCAFAWNLMIRPENLRNVLYLRLSIIIWSEVYIFRSSDAKNLCNVVWINGELFFSYPTLQLNFGISCIWIEFLYQFINWFLEVPE